MLVPRTRACVLCRAQKVTAPPRPGCGPPPRAAAAAGVAAAVAAAPAYAVADAPGGDAPLIAAALAFFVAVLVDAQNEGSAGYKALAPTFDGPEWHAARELIFDGTAAPNGLTEATLTKHRRARKDIDAAQAQAEAEAEAEAAERGWKERVARTAGTGGGEAGYVRRGSSMGGAI